jgi:ATP-dependent Lon protease
LDAKDIVQSEQNLPETLYLIPLLGKPVFPGIFTPIMISSDEDKKLVEKAMEKDNTIGLILTKEDDEENPTIDDLFQVGTAARIVKSVKLPDGSINIFITTVKRFIIKENIGKKAPFMARVEYVDDITNGPEEEIKALTRSLLQEMKELSLDNPLFTEEMRLNMVNIDNPGKIADFIASILNVDRLKQQKVLETFNVRNRIEQVLVFMKNEQHLIRIQKKVAGEINERIEKNQREYFLREELKEIKKELGEPSDARSSEHLKFKEIIDKLDFEGEIKDQVETELEKFAMMEPQSSEYIVTRNYLDTIVNLPWEDPEPDEINMAKGEKILNRDHYGLEDVKERILEYLAVRKLKKDTKGSIILLVGPPGVGKTSIGKSIADTLDRKFFRFSVGGMRDEAEIKGHRRTYIGSMPGKIIQGLKIVKSKAPVFMIDEIDKLGASYQGDPSSALLEALDPEQNVEFRDHYLDIPFDLSHILFICTANTMDSIPRPLLDRMEVIRLSGYITDEKVEIAKRYLIPKSLKVHGLDKKTIRYRKAALVAIADGYAREAGMRNFEKCVNRINRKVARKIVTGVDELPITISKANIEEYLKKPYFREGEIKKADKPGTTIGLAWTSMGGDTLIIESVALPGKGGLKLTGQMGDVMKESASLAYTYARKIAGDLGVDQEFFEKNTIHLHIPEGATPKDGPSAGITMTSALLSLALNKKIKPSTAMTGELSLTGKVHPIGGLKEKTIAARRNKIKHIIIPADNERDLDEIPENIKKGITFYPVAMYEEVREILFPDI